MVKQESADTDVVVLCGGRGTRLGPLTASVPKPLLPIGEQPFLLHALQRMQAEGFRRFILAAHYLAEQFREFAVKYETLVPGITILVEPRPLGTGGALRYAVTAVQSDHMVVLNGDSWVTQRLVPVLAAHGRKGRDFTAVAVDAARVQGGAVNKGVLDVNPSGELLSFSTKAAAEGWVNAGIYVMSRSLVSRWPDGAYSLEENFASLLAGSRCGVFCSIGRLLDIGTPECYELAQQAVGSRSELVAGTRSA